jgi:hypothetical protein
MNREMNVQGIQNGIEKDLMLLDILMGFVVQEVTEL